MRKPFPSPITTDRLILRTPTASDAVDLNEAIRETWDQLALWMPWAVALPSLEESLQICHHMASITGAVQDFPLFGFERETGRFVLGTGFHPKDLAVPSYAIGYWCRASCQNKGYVTEAISAITEVGFEAIGAHRIEIRCDSRNLASRAVAERCGYLLEGEIVNDSRTRLGELRNSLVFAKTRTER